MSTKHTLCSICNHEEVNPQVSLVCDKCDTYQVWERLIKAWKTNAPKLKFHEYLRFVREKRDEAV